MNRCTIAIAVMSVLVFLAAMAHAVAAEPQRNTNDSEADQLKALQTERIEVLTQLVKYTTAQYGAGRSTIDSVVSAENQLVEAQLDSTDEPDKRVALLTQQLETVSEVLKLAEAMMRAGHGSQGDVYRAKSLYLDVKIRLLRERKNRPPTPTPSGKQP